MQEDVIGKIIQGKYEIEKEINHGNMGVIYQARRIEDNMTVALKFPSKSTSLEKFRQIAVLSSSLESPGIAKVYEHGGVSEPFVVMEYLDGEPLSDFLSRHKRLSPTRAAAIALECSRILQYLHSRYVVHNDVKPANIFILRTGEIKLLDLGVAKTESLPGGSAGDNFGGSPEYSAPERRQGISTPETDVYSLGKTLLEMLTGHTFVTGRWPVLPPTLVKIVKKCLQQKPQMRYRNMEALAEDIERFMTRQQGLRRKIPFTGLWVILILVALVLAVIALAMLL